MESFNELKFLRFRSPLGVVYFSRRFRIVSMNKRAERCWGVGLPEVRQPTCKSTCPFRESSLICRNCVARRSVQDGKIHRSVNRTSEGEIYLLTGFPARDEDTIVGSVMTLENITSRVGLEDELKYSETYTKVILSSLNEGVFLLDGRGTFLMVNRAMVKTYGIGQKEFRTMGLLDFIDTAYRDNAQSGLTNVLAGSEPRPFKATCGRSNGRKVYGLFRLFPFPLNGAARVLGTVQDFSSDLKLKKDLRFLKRALDWNCDVLLITNDEGRITFANSAAMEMMGEDGKTLLGKDVYRLLKFPKPLQTSLLNSKQNVWSTEYRSKTAGTEPLLYHLSIRHVYEKGNELSGCVVTGHSLDPSSRNKEERQPSHDLLSIFSGGRQKAPNGLTKEFMSFLENISIGVFIQTDDGIVYANGALYDLMRYNARQMSGRSFANFIVEDSGQAIRSFITRSLNSRSASGGLLRRECNLLRSDGSATLAYLDLRAATFEGKRAVVGNVTDINARGRLLNTECTMASSKLAYNAIHEISQPLQSMFGALKKIRDLSSDHENEQACTTIEEGLERIDNTLRAMISVYKPEYTKKSYISFNDIVRKSVDTSRNTLEKNGIVLKLSLSPYVQKTMASPHQMLQLFNVMILRAAKSMPFGGALTISSRKRGNNVVLEFQDTGIGMSGEECKKVFDPLYNTGKDYNDNSTQDLSWAQAIVKQHDGEVRIRSILGKGARFSIILPIAAR